MKVFLGVLAGVVVIVGTIPYIRDILQKTTRPARSTWTLLTLLIFIDLLVQNDIGVGWAIALTIGEVIATGSVFILALKYGKGGLDKIDIACYVLWGMMVVCWLILDKPLLALHFGITADFISLVPTFFKSWKEPHEETKSVFVTSSIAGFFGLLAVDVFIYEQMLLPLYLMLANAAVALTIYYAEKQNNHSKVTI